jgi:hypothetical protein
MVTIRVDEIFLIDIFSAHKNNNSRGIYQNINNTNIINYNPTPARIILPV